MKTLVFLLVAFPNSLVAGEDKNSLLILPSSLASFFAWSAIHESSHALIDYRLGSKDLSIKPYPHFEDDAFMFGSISGTHTKLLTYRQNILSCEAPRFMNLLAVIVLPFTAKLKGDSRAIITPLVMGGVVDLLYGSLGYSKYSDLQQAFPDRKQRNVARITGITLVAWSITMWYLLSEK